MRILPAQPKFERIRQWHLLNGTPADVIKFADENNYHVPEAIKLIIPTLMKEIENVN